VLLPERSVHAVPPASSMVSSTPVLCLHPAVGALLRHLYHKQSMCASPGCVSATSARHQSVLGYLAGLASVCSLCSRPVPALCEPGIWPVVLGCSVELHPGSKSQYRVSEKPLYEWGVRTVFAAFRGCQCVSEERGHVCLQLSCGTSVLAHTSDGVRVC
jgi:hypothetical protein